MKGSKAQFLSRRFEPWVGPQRLQHGTNWIRGIGESASEGSADDPFIIPPAWDIFDITTRLAGHTEIEVADQPQFSVEVIVSQRREHGFAQSERQGHQVGQGEAHLESPAMPLKSSAQAEVPATFYSGQVLMNVHACQERDRCGVGDFSIEERGQTVATGQAIKKMVRSNVLFPGAARRPIGELSQRAAP